MCNALATMDLSIIIVNWNTKDLLRTCLNSIFEKTRGVTFEVFVIDNASKDGSVEMIRQNFPNVRLIANSQNKGFAAANNQGIQLSRGANVVLLNPDTELIEDSLTLLVTFMEHHRNCGICGCHLLNPDRSHQSSVRRFPTFPDQLLILLKIHHLFPNTSIFQRYQAHDMDYTKAQSVDQVMGACFLVKRVVFEKIGLLDQRFFNWFEEVDFCKRAKGAGYSIWYTGDTSMIHHYGQSFGQLLPLPKQKMWNRSLRYYFYKHHSIFAFAAIALASWISLIMVGVLQRLRAIAPSTHARNTL